PGRRARGARARRDVAAVHRDVQRLRGVREDQRGPRLPDLPPRPVARSRAPQSVTGASTTLAGDAGACPAVPRQRAITRRRWQTPIAATVPSAMPSNVMTPGLHV